MNIFYSLLCLNSSNHIQLISVVEMAAFTNGKTVNPSEIGMLLDQYLKNNGFYLVRGSSHGNLVLSVKNSVDSR